jgi:hypothetical protein
MGSRMHNIVIATTGLVNKFVEKYADVSHFLSKIKAILSSLMRLGFELGL